MSVSRLTDVEGKPLSSWRAIKLTLLCWLAMLGFDFFLHGGLLAGFYAGPSPFLLPPLVAFRRIPIGYLSVLIVAGLLVWLFIKIGIRGWAAGLRAGAVIGGAMWISLALGLYSISAASPMLLLAWAAGQTFEMAYGGAVLGYGIEAQSLRKPFIIVGVATIGFVILTVVMQSVGLAPALQAG